MRKSLAIISLLVVAIFAAVPVLADTTHEYDLKADGIYYTICEDGLQVQRSPYTIVDTDIYPLPHAEYSGDIVVPELVYVPSLGRELPVVSTVRKAFAYCDSLHTVKLPSSLVVMESDAFTGSCGLVSVDMSACSEIISLPEFTFSYCSALESVVLPNALVEIGTGAFMNSGIKEFRVPDGVRSIDDQAFCGSGLRHLVMGTSLSFVGEYSFYCGLEKVEWNEALGTIYYSAFYGSELTEVTIPAQVKGVYSGAFAKMKNLQAVVCQVSSPDDVMVDSHAFDAPEGCVLYVPAQSVELYRQADVWKEFAEIRAIDDEETALEQLTSAAGADGATYDLMGRRVESPRPGQLVVSGGKLRLIR